jgi:uncharacterized protein YjbI with pentapeptide repeats
MAKSSGAEYNPIPDDIKKKLDRHQAWLEFSAAGGTPADLTGEKGLRNTDLSGYSLRGAVLVNTELMDTNLTGVDLTETTGLLPKNLAGADLTRAKLPPEIQFTDALANVAEMSKNAGKYSIGLLAGSLYSLITVGTATDLALVTNTGGSTLPIINIAMPMGGFCLLAPLILLGGFLFFHITMQRLWEALTELPAVLQDGRPLDQVSYPWLLNGLVRFHLPRLRRNAIPIGFTQSAISLIAAWVVTPVVMLCIWWVYIRVHNWLFTYVHIAVIVMAVGMADTTYRLMRRTLRREGDYVDALPSLVHRPDWWGRVVAAGVFAFVLWGLSWSAIDGIPTYRYANDALYPLPLNLRNISRYDPRRLVPYFSSRFDLRTTLNVSETELSAKMKDYKKIQLFNLTEREGRQALENWKEGFSDKFASELEEVHGVTLTGQDLRFSDLHDCFLEKAGLRDVRLDYAGLSAANLRGARLTGTSLIGADLRNADLTGAYLQGAHFNNAHLIEVHLDGAHLEHTDLTGADLTGADLTGTDLRNGKRTAMVNEITLEQLLTTRHPEEALLEPGLKKKLLTALKVRKKNPLTGVWEIPER